MGKRKEWVIEYLGEAPLPPGVTARQVVMSQEEIAAVKAEAAALGNDPVYQEQSRQAKERARIADETQPRVVAVRYDHATARLVLDLRNGVTVMIPIALLQGLAVASPAEIEQVEIWSNGAALHWEALDVDFTVPGLVAGVFGTRAWMEKIRASARKGGLARSKAKVQASRENGKRGGRPRKAPPGAERAANG
jgi:hypothetical protein